MKNRFNISHANGRLSVYRWRGERFVDTCVLQKNRLGSGSVLVWGGILDGLKTRLNVEHGNLNAKGYMNHFRVPEALPFIQTLQQDNADPHTARKTEQFLQRDHINVLPWPAINQALNPVEHILDGLGRRVLQQNITTIQELRNALQAAWNNLILTSSGVRETVCNGDL